MFQKTVTVVQPKSARPASAHHAAVLVSGKSGVLVMDHVDLDTENERSKTPVLLMPTENRHHHKLKPKTVAKKKDAPTWNGKNGANATLNATLSVKNSVTENVRVLQVLKWKMKNAVVAHLLNVKHARVQHVPALATGQTGDHATDRVAAE
jgi:hypothetical protein